MNAEPKKETSRILIVEDEKDIADLMAFHLKREGYECTIIDNGEDALQNLKKDHSYQLTIVDWMLPGLSGLEFCKKWRNNRNIVAAEKIQTDPSPSPSSWKIPILMVTARAHPSDLVLGLEMGADDYLTKPFELSVFLARVRALIRRATHTLPASSRKIQMGDVFIDLDGHQVICKEKEIALTPSEFKLLVALSQSQGKVLTRSMLIDLVQGEGVTVIDRTIDTHIFGLRKKLGKCADLIETIRGIGYRVSY